MSQLKNVIPHIPSKDIDATVEFLTGLFDFEIRKHSASYTELILGQNLLGVLEAHGEPDQQSIYLRVSDVDGLWSRIQPNLSQIKFKAPFNQGYGMREIHIIIPHTNTLLFIGQPINA
jgi:predicted enzyme related to lactoylglutathione lyase